MKIPHLFAIFVTLILLAAPRAVQLAGIERPVAVAGEILLQFRDTAGEDDRRRVLAAHGLQLIRVLRARGILKLRVPEGIDPQQLAARLRSLAEVEAAEPNYFRYLNAIPNDPRFGEMWGLRNIGQTGGVPDADIDADDAWNITTGSQSVVVAVIDSGIDMTHPDLVANIYTNPKETLNGADDDGNGFIDDVHGWDFVDNDNDPTDPSALCSSHGTHTAGTIGAVGNNGIGVTGVAQTVKIMPLRAFFVAGIFCTARDSDLLEALDYVARMQVPISNNSYGGGPYSQLMANAIAATRGLFVAAAGNDGSSNDTTPSYPASYHLGNILAVAATTNTDALASFSNFGASVQLGAPGQDILSTIRGGDYGLLSGTSMSAPHVAGAAALLLAQDPTLTAHELRMKLILGTDPKGLPVATGGRLNINKALTLPKSAVTVTVTPQGSTELPPGTNVTYSVTVRNTASSTRTVTATVRTWIPGGAEVALEGPRTVSLAAGQTASQNFTANVPANAPPGTYRLIGRVQNKTDTFDESQVVYLVQ